MHTPNHVHDIFTGGRQKLFSDHKDLNNKVTLKIRAVSPAAVAPLKNEHSGPAKDDILVKESKTQS